MNIMNRTPSWSKKQMLLVYGKLCLEDGNQAVTVTHSNGLVENYSYDAMGNIVNESDSNGRNKQHMPMTIATIIKKTDSYGKQ